MSPSKRFLRFAALALIGSVGASAAMAADVTKKWRFSVAGGFFNAQDEVPSNSANVLILLDPCLRTNTCVAGTDFLQGAFQDPRSDSAVFGNLDLQSAALGTFSVQYGLHKSSVANYIVEASVGYQRGDLGDVELQAQFIGNAPSLDEIDFNFCPNPSPGVCPAMPRISVGEVETIPIQLTGLVRLRPRANFNPYFGAGVGYNIVGVSLTKEFNDLSLNMDQSRGVQMRLTDVLLGGGSTVTDGLPQVDLEAASIDVSDTFAWHLVAGTEYTFKKKWAAFIDARWVDASRSVTVGFNNSTELGVSVPNFTDFNDSPLATKRYGPVLIGSCPKNLPCSGGGLVDVGRVATVPAPGAPQGTDCLATPSLCIVDYFFEPDGILDAGQYYVQGGAVDYDGISLLVGIRFTLP